MHRHRNERRPAADAAARRHRGARPARRRIRHWSRGSRRNTRWWTAGLCTARADDGTIGADFATHDFNIDGKKVTFQIWDLAGQDTFRSVRARFFRGSMAGLCIFDDIV